MPSVVPTQIRFNVAEDFSGQSLPLVFRRREPVGLHQFDEFCHRDSRQSETGMVLLQPVSRRFGKEFFQGNALSADKQLPLGLEQPDEGIHAGKRFVARAAFHFTGNGRFSLLQNNVHFMISLAPTGDADVCAETGIDQMSADAGFDQSSPKIAVVPRPRDGAVVLRAHQGGVQHLQFWTGTALAHLTARLLAQPGQIFGQAALNEHRR